MMTREIVKPVFVRKKRKGLPGKIPHVDNKVNSYQYKNNDTQNLLFDMDEDAIKDGRNKLKFGEGRNG